MARTLGLSKFLKSKKPASTPPPTSMSATSNHQHTAQHHLSVKSRILPTVLKSTGQRIKKLFTKSKKVKYFLVPIKLSVANAT